MWLECVLATNGQLPNKPKFNWTAIGKAIYLEAANNVLCRRYEFWTKSDTLKTSVASFNI